MTDTFANGPSATPGASPQAAQQTGDVTGTLAELERKLRELERELSSIGRRRTLAGAGSAQDTTMEAPTQTGGRLVDEAIEPPAAVAPQPPLTSPAAPVAPATPLAPHTAPAAPATPQGPAAEAVAPHAPAEPAGTGQPVKFMRPLESARVSASRASASRESTSREPTGQDETRTSGESRIGREPHTGGEPGVENEPQATLSLQERQRPSEAQLASLAELRRFRDRLERFARDLTAEYDALLGRVMSGLTAAVNPTASPTSAHAPGDSAPAARDAPSASAPTATASVTPLRADAPASPEDALFEGRVELGVGPFYDIASLSAFERRLASLPYVVEASVRRFEASHAVVDLRLAAPVALVAELRRTAETDFSIREVADGRILLTFDDV
jgi:hypothetical protein